MVWSPLVEQIIRFPFDEEAMIQCKGDLETPTSRGGSTPLFFAALNGEEAEALSWLLRLGGNVHARNSYGETPLHWAAQMGHGNVIKLLLSYGADIYQTDGDGLTALDWSVDQEHTHLYPLLGGQIPNAIHSRLEWITQTMLYPVMRSLRQRIS